jgi:hypothetical protein
LLDFHEDGLHAFVRFSINNNHRHFYVHVYVVRNETSKFALDRSFELALLEDEDWIVSSNMKTYQDFLILFGSWEFPGNVVVYNWKEGGNLMIRGTMLENKLLINSN